MSQVFSSNNSYTRTPVLFTVDGCDNNSGLVGQDNLEFQMAAYDVENLPITWQIASFSGDLENVTIDNTGRVSYDVPVTIQSNGEGLIVIRATDANGNQVTRSICTNISDPILVEPLACNDDLEQNSPDIVAALNIFANPSPSRVFQDLAKTIPATTGDAVQVLEDSRGFLDLTTWTQAGGAFRDSNGPTYEPSSLNFNANPSLSFDGTNDEGLAVVTGNAGGPFKFVAIVSASGGGQNAAIISAVNTSVLGGGELGVGTWQISRNQMEDSFIFRYDTLSPFTSKILDTVNHPAARDFEVAFSSWDYFTDGNPHLIVVDYDGSLIRGYMDGTHVWTVQPADVPAGNQFRFGVNRGGGGFVSMELAELVIAGNTLTNEQLTELQSYFLCKYRLDASLISDPGPFEITSNFYTLGSQFERHTFSTTVQLLLANGQNVAGQVFIFDTINKEYYQENDVPVPGLGVLSTSLSDSLALAHVEQPTFRQRVLGETMELWCEFDSTLDGDQTFTFPVIFGGAGPRLSDCQLTIQQGSTAAGSVTLRSVTPSTITVNRIDSIDNADNPLVSVYAIGPRP